MLNVVQSSTRSCAAVLPCAKALSHFGEHSAGWVVLAGIGAVADDRRRSEWLWAAGGAVAAHAASIAVKRMVRRPRPTHPSVSVEVGTPGKLSFPSSHASSSTAAAVLLGRLTGLPLPLVVVPGMAVSRLVLGVHYPTDVLAGSTLGAATAIAVRHLQRRRAPTREES